MKKWLKSLTVIAALVLTIIPCVLFSACGSGSSDHTPAEGDTYVFESAKIEWTAEVDETTKTEYEAFIAKQTEYMDGTKVVVKADNKFAMVAKDGEENEDLVPYTIENGKVIAGEGESKQELTIDGDTLVMEQVMPDMQDETKTLGKMVMVYKLSK